MTTLLLTLLATLLIVVTGLICAAVITRRSWAGREPMDDIRTLTPEQLAPIRSYKVER